MIELLGMFAAILTTASFLPQALLVVRTGKTDGISATMYAMFTVGVFAWLVYGVMIGSLPVILANAVTLALAATILSLKVKSMFQQRKVRGVGLLNQA